MLCDNNLECFSLTNNPACFSYTLVTTKKCLMLSMAPVVDIKKKLSSLTRIIYICKLKGLSVASLLSLVY
jgi:hypothetical protein